MYKQLYIGLIDAVIKKNDIILLTKTGDTTGLIMRLIPTI